MLGSLLTTQQKSGSDSRVARFLESDNQLLQLEYCQNHEDIAQKAEEVFVDQGLRFTKRNAGFVESALALIKDEWQNIFSWLETLAVKSSEVNAISSERAVAQYLQKFKGIGPKQSRNLIQHLGLSRYEIPLDSRVMKVLRSEFDFPVPLSAAALSDEQYYCFIEDGIQRILSQVNILPCVFDACAFASMEKKAKSL